MSIMLNLGNLKNLKDFAKKFIQEKPKNVEELLYSNESRPTKEDLKTITNLITQLSIGGSIFKIIPNYKEIEKLGKNLYGIHPLRTFAVICNDTDLREKMKKIWEYKNSWIITGLSLVREECISGFTEAFIQIHSDLRENGEGDLVPNLNNFCYRIGFIENKEMSAEVEKMKTFIEKKEWENFLETIIFDEPSSRPSSSNSDIDGTI